MTDTIEPSGQVEERRRLNAAERHRAIVGYLDLEGRVEAADLAERLVVAVETVRRDLRLLEDRGELQRAHGGAVPVGPLERPARPVPTTGSAALGAAAARHVPAGGSVLIGQGQPCLALAAAVVEEPRQWGGLRVATTSVEVAILLSRREDLMVYNLGGTVGSESAQHGQWTMEELGRISVDVAFLAPSGVDVVGGLTLDDERDGEVAQAVVESSRRLVVLADGSSVGSVGFWRFGTMREVDVLVVDKGAAERELTAITELGVALERA